jgi:hypothetical protein
MQAKDKVTHETIGFARTRNLEECKIANENKQPRTAHI